MEIIETGISGLVEFVPNILSDNRGWFVESYNKETLKAHGFEMDFVQDNLSFSHAGVLRGLHFQNEPFEQGKLVKVIQGEVLDVAVDLRPGSVTFGKHYKTLLTAEKQNMLYMPEGFAHGFAAIKDSYLFYKCTRTYNRPYDSGISFDDPELDIDWGIASPIISQKDQNLQSFQSYKSSLKL